MNLKRHEMLNVKLKSRVARTLLLSKENILHINRMFDCTATLDDLWWLPRISGLIIASFSPSLTPGKICLGRESGRALIEEGFRRYRHCRFPNFLLVDRARNCLGGFYVWCLCWKQSLGGRGYISIIQLLNWTRGGESKLQADIISTCPLASDELLAISCRNLKRVMKRRTEGEIINAEMSAKRGRRIQMIKSHYDSIISPNPRYLYIGVDRYHDSTSKEERQVYVNPPFCPFCSVPLISRRGRIQLR